MSAFNEQQIIADGYLDEMLQAERNRDHAAWSRRWLNNESGVSQDVFLADLKHMHEVLGHYRSREYLGVVRGRTDETCRDDPPTRLRFVWKVIFEKNEALYVVGLHQVDGVWYVNDCPCSL